MKQGGFGHREVVVRINGLDTQWGRDDLAAIAPTGAEVILIPKVNDGGDLIASGKAIAAAGAPERTAVWAMMETPLAMLNAGAIAAAAKERATRLTGFVMGTNDLAKEMRARLTPERTPFLPILSLAVAAARAHGVAILDGVCNEFRDLDVFRAEAEQGLLFGFDGKSLIHPDQIAPCNAVFSPGAAELTWAQAVIDAFALPGNAGKGAIRVDGKMAELLHLEDARRLIAVAHRIAAADALAV